MSRFRNNISVAFLVLAIAGTLLSMAHYHSEGLECVHHANEQHYAESDPVCPVCTLTALTDAGHNPTVTHVLEFQEVIKPIEDLLIVNEFFTPLLGRAPPIMI